MATALPNTVDTLLNWTKGRDPDQKAADIVEILNQSNEIISYMLWEESNGPLMNRTTVRVALPTVSSRQIGAGIPISTSRVAQFDDAMSILDVMNEVDIALAKLNGEAGAYRLRMALPYFEALSQKFATLFFYGNSTTTPSDFFGLSARYPTVTAANAANAINVLDGGGVGSANTSCWFLTLADKALTGIFPKGMAAGLQHKDWGEQMAQVTAGYGATILPVYRDQYTWNCGLALKDWRWCVRVANIDANNLAAENNAADLIKLLIKAYYRLPSIATPASGTGNPMSSFANPGRSVIVCNRTVREMLHIQTLNKANNTVAYMEVAGQKILTFLGVPVINCDQLLNTEARVV
jgi:hypothetical protein